MREISILTVGKLKNSNLKSIENEYLKRITNVKLEVIELKSSDNRNIEAKDIIKKIDNHSFIILLTEYGKCFESLDFANWWGQQLEIRREKIYLVLAGADGPGDEISQRANFKLSLSPLTFAHQLARVILIEQLYRAQSILEKHPYHK